MQWGRTTSSTSTDRNLNVAYSNNSYFICGSGIDLGNNRCAACNVEDLQPTTFEITIAGHGGSHWDTNGAKVCWFAVGY